MVVDPVIREYYACFNERRLSAVGRVLSKHAVLEQIPFGHQESGLEGYVRFATGWIIAFPDAAFAIERIERRTDAMFDVHLVATGTHRGVFDIGVFRFRPTSHTAVFRLRELLNIENDRIVSSTVSFDVAEMVDQLSVIDYEELTTRLDRIRTLSDELGSAAEDASKREVANRIGLELDAARRALRPHYYRH